MNPIFGCQCTVTSTSQISSVCTPIIHVSYTVSSGNGLDVYPKNTSFQSPSNQVLYKLMLLWFSSGCPVEYHDSNWKELHLSSTHFDEEF